VSDRKLPDAHIAPSILASNFSRLGEDVTMTMDAGARVIHFDVMDGHFVPPITIGALVLDSISDLVHDRGGLLDVHLMIESPENQIEAFAKAGADVITIHPEATPNIHRALGMIRQAGCLAGVSINPGTPVSAIEPLVELIDLCLCMTVNPGWGGQAFIPTSNERIAQFRSLIPDDVTLEVDGGISLETIAGARAAGANLFVAGSSVFGAADPPAMYKALAAAVA
jgi:ribulose-phosphate 3-epimerase